MLLRYREADQSCPRNAVSHLRRTVRHGGFVIGSRHRECRVADRGEANAGIGAAHDRTLLAAVARTATGAAAFAGTLSGAWRAVRARVVPIATQLEQPLWGSELDAATAEAVTIPPVGALQDAVLESACKRAPTEVITAAAQPQQVFTAGS
jgi:hypothetical protein